MGGSWIWQCQGHTGGPVGDSFSEDEWRNPWDACLGTAVKHFSLYHADVEPIEVGDL